MGSRAVGNVTAVVGVGVSGGVGVGGAVTVPTIRPYRRLWPCSG